MQRISIVGSSGSGKTTLATVLSDRIGVSHVELDAINHQANWQALSHDDFQAAVRPLVAQDSWVIDGNYHRTGVQDIIWDRADTIIWLDLPRWTTMRRVTGRTLRRAFTREELWNGNREEWKNMFHPDPEVNLLTWTWTRYKGTRSRYESASQSAEWEHVNWIHLQSQNAINQFVDQLA